MLMIWEDTLSPENWQAYILISAIPGQRPAMRRLTYREKLKNYRSVMSPEGTIEFKTDNDGLFAFTIDEIRNAGLSIWEMTTDLAASTFESKLFTTEYEERFGSAGKNINYVKFK